MFSMESTSGRLSEADLRGYFGKYGEVMHALVLSDKDRRGFGCITYKDLETINIVIREESSVDVKPALCISESIQEQNNHSEQLHNNGTSINKKIFVGRLPSDLTELEFKDYFESFGTVTDASFVYDKKNHKPRGLGFVSFDSEEAVDNVLQKGFHKLKNRTVEVKRAKSEEDRNQELHNNGTSIHKIFVKGIPNDLTEPEFKKYLIVLARLLRLSLCITNKPTNRGALDLLVSIQRKLWRRHCRIGVTNWKVGLWRLRGLNLTSMGNDNVNDKWKESDNQSSLILDMIHWYNWHLLAGVLYGDIQTSIYHCQSNVM